MRIKSTETHIHEAIFTETEGESDIYMPMVMQQCIGEINGYFNGTTKHFSVPLNPFGTPFQISVWEEINKIKFGDTVSYSLIAQRISDETATRAVGAAIGQNKLAILIPCHRITGVKGELRGYAWGLEKKKWLLDYESKQSGKYMKLF